MTQLHGYVHVYFIYNMFSRWDVGLALIQKTAMFDTKA
jgi:hypothetical protein